VGDNIFNLVITPEEKNKVQNVGVEEHFGTSHRQTRIIEESQSSSEITPTL